MSETIYAYSELTDTWYRVFDFDQLEGNKIVANSKTPVDEEDVPEEWKTALESCANIDGEKNEH